MSLTPETLSHTFESLEPGAYYRFRMTATNVVGESFWSEYTEHIPAGVEPTRPGVISFESTTRTTINYKVQTLTGLDTGGTDAAPMAMSNSDSAGYHGYISKDGEDY